MKLEAWAVVITAGSREVRGRKGLWQETTIIIIIIIMNEWMNEWTSKYPFDRTCTSIWRRKLINNYMHASVSTDATIRLYSYKNSQEGIMYRNGSGQGTLFTFLCRTGWIYLTCKNFHRISLLVFVCCVQSWTCAAEIYVADVACYVATRLWCIFGAQS